MIFRLIELEHSWKTHLALWVFVCFVEFGFASSVGPSWMVFDGAIAAGSFWMVFPHRNRQPRCTPLQAALPIRARDIFLSHLLLDLIYCWAYNFTSVAIATEFHLNPTNFALDVSAITSVGVVAIHSARTRECNVPRLWKWIIGLGTLAMLAVALGTHYKPQPAVPPVYVLPACALAAVALFWIDWVSFPEAFELAPRGPIGPKSDKGRFRLPEFAGLPFLRAFAGKSSISIGCALLVVGLVGSVFLGIVCIFCSFFVTLLRLRTTESWLFLLPVSRQKLFAAMIVPPLGFFALGSFIAICCSSQSPREAILGVAAVAVFSLLALFAAQIPSLVYRLRVAWVLLLTCTVCFLVCWTVWRWCGPATGLGGMRKPPIVAISENALPNHLLLLMAMGAAGLAALYWLAYAGFRRMQVKPQRITVSYE